METHQFKANTDWTNLNSEISTQQNEMKNKKSILSVYHGYSQKIQTQNKLKTTR
jgi:hypothetical protein